MVGVAKRPKAPDCGSGIRGFESHHPPQKKEQVERLALFSAKFGFAERNLLRKLNWFAPAKLPTAAMPNLISLSAKAENFTMTKGHYFTFCTAKYFTKKATRISLSLLLFTLLGCIFYVCKLVYKKLYKQVYKQTIMYYNLSIRT